MKIYSFIVCVWAAVFIVGCKEPYDIPVTSSQQQVLVVEGSLSSSGISTIMLSRTFSLNDTARLPPVSGALLTVEGKDNSIDYFAQAENGRYTAQLDLQTGQEYLLRIKTPDGKEYVSDYVTPIETPAIDSVNWKRTNDGLTIFVNTHDAGNDTRYYRWAFEETWELRSGVYSTYKYVDGQIIPRNMVDDDVSVCWRNNNSTKLLLGSSAQLQSDVIFEQPLQTIPSGADKLSVRYSILVKQFALDKQAYEYLKLMKTNTESLGTVFDPQPSEIKGNIHCVTNPEEPVVGYLTASQTKEQRIFIAARQVPNWGFFLDCTSLEIPNNPDSIQAYVPLYLPYDAKKSGLNSVSHWFVATPTCVDCTLRGGKTVKPSFW
jgi:hypothetical protein